MKLQTLTDILKAELGDQLMAEAHNFLDMFAEDGILECPYAPEGAMHQLIGKPAIASYYEKLSELQVSAGMELTGSYHAPHGSTLVLEYNGTVENKRDFTSYPQRYIAVVETRDGRLTLFREYWNPKPVVESFGPKGPIALDEPK